MANARNVSTSFLPYGGITYLINSFDYPNLNWKTFASATMFSSLTSSLLMLQPFLLIMPFVIVSFSPFLMPLLFSHAIPFTLPHTCLLIIKRHGQEPSLSSYFTRYHLLPLAYLKVQLFSSSLAMEPQLSQSALWCSYRLNISQDNEFYY